MTDLDNLKSQWQKIKIDTISYTGENNGNNLRDNTRGHSLTQRILRRYRMMLVVAILGLINAYPFMDVMHPPVWILIYYILFIGFCGINVARQMRILELSNVIEMPVVDAIRFTETFIRKRARTRNIQLFFAVIFVILLIIWMFSNYHFDIATGGLAGALIGGLIGGILGYRTDTKFKRDLLDLKRFLGEFPDDNEIDKLVYTR